MEPELLNMQKCDNTIIITLTRDSTFEHSKCLQCFVDIILTIMFPRFLEFAATECDDGL